MNPDTEKVLVRAVYGASSGGLLSAAGSIVSGTALVTTPVRVLWIFTVGASTAVSWPVVLAWTIGGALSGAVAGALTERRRQERINREFADILSAPPGGNADMPGSSN